ncbi:hypothetical protein P8R33_11745 [Qipengyuania sp. XHP0211]|uniref:hypothetical protein n=1 Tax=Qipengyuania sp. XHP0211 TaxID=3038079 RepID=UPI00241DCAD3|nr:hypothetical protein [Qipengyuania sp. XHP0211]MDG5751782.1 hypothetical protein [Qipengyuania sp. XHP0211]
MERQLPARLIRLAPVLLPLLAIALARAMTFTDWAAANAVVAALLFAWIVADSLLLATIAKAEDRKAGLRAMLGAGAAASVIVLIGAAAPVREAIYAMPPLLAAAALTLALFVAWSGALVVRALAGGASIEDAAAIVLPPKLVRFMSAESRIMRLALWGWRREQDIPAGAQGFAYHRFLLPMIYVFLALQAIELAVIHFLLIQWNATVAWIWFGLGIAGSLWIVGLAQGFRIHPVLVTEQGLRVRSGVMVDLLVPYDAIAAIVPSFGAEQVKAADTLNHAVLSWPNAMLELDRELTVRPLFGAEQRVRRISLRIDESAAFLAALAERVPQLCR